MVNIFGKEEVRGKSGPRGATGVAGARGPAGEQGPPGVRGERGKAGISGMKDLYSWLGDTTLRDFRRDSEDCSLVIWKEDDDEGTKDLKVNKAGEIVEWISRSISTISGGKRRFRKNAKLLSSTAHPSLHFKYENGYLEMQKSIFKVSDASLTDTYSSLCVTFKVKEQAKEEVQYIVSNWEEPGGIPYVTRGVTASAKEIHVLGSNQLIIAHDCTQWTTILVEWNSELGGRYNVNNGQKRGEFIAQDPGTILYDSVYIGGKSNASQFFKGFISSVEWCSCTDMPDEKSFLPNCIQQLIIEDQTMDDDDSSKPPSHRTMEIIE